MVAVPGVMNGDFFFTSAACPHASVVLDRLKRKVTPSVVAEDANGCIVVGNAAAARLGMTPDIIAFSKRYMGTDRVFRLDNQGELSAADVAAHILRHLKEMTEDALGEAVTDAVITVPARFTLAAKRMTQTAAEQAGLNVLQLVPEPMAAGLTYCVDDPRDPLTIMVCNLGSGFDVAIMRKENGPVASDTILAFDGDMFLGGYNFDDALAYWIMEQLIRTGYSLKLDLDDPKDKVAFAKLMVIAEQTKIALSCSATHVILEPASGIVDHDGTPVTIEMEISRSQFEDMISKYVHTIVAICSRALTRAEITPDQIDEIVMVGGSVHIPLVSQRLEEAFRKHPKVVIPDLCVALGAGIVAAGYQNDPGLRPPGASGLACEMPPEAEKELG